MDTKIFLNKFDGKNSVSDSGALNVSLKGNRKLIPFNDMGEVISSLDVYNDERRECNKIRLTCQVNPICSNVLFNHISEIVKYEGSEHVAFINYAEEGDQDPFGSNQVIYKSKEMDFWSSGVMNYQTIDNELLGTSVQTPISDLARYASEPPRTTDFARTQGEYQYHPTNSIRDTQLSRNDDNGEHFVYHCGLDILNNHLIRSKTFKCICRMPNDSYERNNEYDGFNTIADYMRDVNGSKVIEKLYFPTKEDSLKNRDYTKLLTLHTYLYDDVFTFEEAIEEKLVRTYNGWVGFYNTSKIKSYEDFVEGNDLRIERPLMYLNGGDFVDMYPGRDLYSFVPKFNHYRQRIEKNWNYCLTYPSSSTTEGFDDIIERNDGIDSLKTIYFDETRRSDNGTKMLVMHSKARHGLSQGDYVNIYRTYVTDLFWVSYNGNRVSEMFETEEEAINEKKLLEISNPTKEYDIETAQNQTVNRKIIDNAEVDNIVDNFIFTVFNQGIEISRKWVLLTEEDLNSETLTVDDVVYNHFGGRRGYYYLPDNPDVRYYIVGEGEERYVNFDDNAQRISYKKVVNDIECEYYVRIFSRLPNFKYSSGDTSNEYEIYRPREDKTDTRNLIDIYQQQEFDFESHVSRLAFARNIYRDEVGEIVFTDDIDLSFIKDNLGRPLSEIFVTIVKNNKGYKEWYGFNRDIDINDSTVEYSHCFGKITCGFEMSDESIFDDNANNIKRINNINGLTGGYDIDMLNGDTHRTYLDGNDNAVDIDIDEIWFDNDTKYYGDLCYYDNYNAIERSIQPILHRFNTAQRESSVSRYSNNFTTFVYDEIAKDDYDTDNHFRIDSNRRVQLNSHREGYYYIPHYQIPIKSYGVVKTVMPDFLRIRSLVNKSSGATITTIENHFLSPGDKSIIYDTSTDKYYYCTTTTGTTDNPKVFTCMICDEDGNLTREVDGNHLTNEDGTTRYKLFKMDNLDIPSYAKVLRDGTCRLIWRDLLNNGFNTADKTLEEYPFTNGAFYVNRRIDMFVRRQDPLNLYGLYAQDDIEGIEAPIEGENNYIREQNIEC